MLEYEFPVSFEQQLRPNGEIIPNRQSIVRTDCEPSKWLSTVSMGYQIVQHKTVMDAANAYISRLGEPQKKYYLNKTGSDLVGEYTFTDKTLALNKGDVVGLRVYVGNSYNGTRSVSFKIGAMVLACTNGMMLPGKQEIGFSYRHNQKDLRIEFPEPEAVLERFTRQKHAWDKLQEIELGVDGYEALLQEAIDNRIIVQKVVESPSHGTTVWDLYNQMTHQITHSEISGFGKLRNTTRVSNWIHERFAA